MDIEACIQNAFKEKSISNIQPDQLAYSDVLKTSIQMSLSFHALVEQSLKALDECENKGIDTKEQAKKTLKELSDRIDDDICEVSEFFRNKTRKTRLDDFKYKFGALVGEALIRAGCPMRRPSIPEITLHDVSKNKSTGNLSKLQKASLNDEVMVNFIHEFS